MTQLQMLADVALAMALGSLIGLERELARKAAGLRTHMLVAGAAAMLVEGARGLLIQFVLPGVSPLVRFDPIPVITAVVTAVGFLGAGTILRQMGTEIEGLTTAASMLFAATVGTSAALREYVLACGATVLALLTLRFVRWIEAKLMDRRPASPRDDSRS